MSMERVYKCDICHERPKHMNEVFGLHFDNLKDFTLGGYGCTEGTHICYRCAKQLKELLNNEQISAQLDACSII